MAIDTNRFVRLLAWGDCLEHLHRRTVKIGYICIEDVRIDAVFCHQLFIGMATSTDLRREQAELGVDRPLNVVRAVTVHAGGHIRVAIADQRRAVNAIFIQIIDLRVALLAGLRDLAARLIGDFDVMSAMAVRANCCILVSLRKDNLVSIIGHGSFFGCMALRAGLVKPDRYVSA